MKFNEIIGQQHIKEHFQSSVVNGTISHAYIINGEKSMGKAMLAKAFTMAIMCDGGGSEPCMECESCRKISNNCNPDVIKLIRDEKKKTDVIGIDEIRQQIISTMYEKPYSGDHKVYIIDDADKMNIQAQNAILKTLEEPPGYAVLILITTNVSRLLPTIISRCIVLNMRPVSDRQIKQYLRERGRLLESDIDVITAMASGNVGKAKLLSEDSDFNEFRNQIIDILSNIPKTDYKKILEYVLMLSDIKKKKKYSQDDIFEFFVIWYRDVLLYKATGESDNIIFRKEILEISKQSEYFTFEALDSVVKLIDEAKSKLKANVNYEAVMEILLINIQEKSK